MGHAMTEEVHLRTVGVPGDAAEAIVVEGLGPTFNYADFDRRWRAWMHDELSRHVPVKPGVHDLIATLQALETPFAIATSTQRDPAERHLTHAGLRGHFSIVVTRDDVKNGKPHPEPFLTAAARLGVDPAHCLAIEDSHNGVRSAHAAGMQVIMVPDLLAPVPEITALTIAVMAHLDEVRAVFENIPAC
jgi:HAD superfamily hydrolase (TIGR01509 family)